MAWLRSIGRTLLALFVDDVGTAITIVLWLLVCWLVLPLMRLSAPWPAIVLFAGLAAILIESTLRRAGRGP